VTDPAQSAELFLTSSAARPPLRIGLLLHSLRLPRWQRAVIEQLQVCDYARIVGARVTPDTTPFESKDGPRESFLFRQYDRLDRQLYGSRRTPRPDERIDSGDLLAAVPLVDELDPPGEEELDVILDFASSELDEDRMPASRHGVWQCRYGPDLGGGPQWAGLRELADQELLTRVSLCRVEPTTGAVEVLAGATTSTVTGVSWALNRFEPLWLGAELIQQTLHRLHAHGVDALEPRLEATASPGCRDDGRSPSSGEIVRFLGAGLTRKAVRRIRPPWGDAVKQWRLAVRPVPAGASALPILEGAHGFRWIEAPSRRHWADPFILERNGRTWLFFEEYLYDEGRGVISVAPLEEDGETGPVTRILDTGGHLSYPFVFEDGGDVYVLPEAADQGATTLYRAVDFPYRWEKVALLGNGLQLLDTTIFRQGGRYWFFTTIPGRYRSGYNLLLFHADSLTGAWHQHPASPISRDIRFARSAGSLIRADGRLYRPVQDGGGGYGRKIHFFEIMELSVDEFGQELRGTVDPSSLSDAPRGLEGIHTYNRTARFEVIDGVRPYSR
jgi:hypothetical protein